MRDIIARPEYHLKRSAKEIVELMEQLENYYMEEGMTSEYAKFRSSYSAQMQELRAMLRDGASDVPV